MFNYKIYIYILELPLGNKDKPLAVLNSNWHQIVQHLSLSSIEVPVVCVRRNVHFSVDKEKLLTDPVTLKYLFSDVSNSTKYLYLHRYTNSSRMPEIIAMADLCYVHVCILYQC